jgi:hypothetical protein
VPTRRAWSLKIENGSTVYTCQTPGVFYQPGIVNFHVEINLESNDYPDITTTMNDVNGDSAWCVVRTGDYNTSPPQNGPSFTKFAFVDAFNVKSFTQPSSAVAMATWTNLELSAAGKTGSITSFPSTRYIATSDGTSSGTVREKPSALVLSGSAFAVSIP